MGQSQGTPDSPSHIGQAKEKLQQHLTIFKRLANLTYKEFVESVSELNRVTSSFTDHRGKQLQFSIKQGTDETFLWKGTVKVECKKVQARTHNVSSTRQLNLRQYVLVYREITEHVSHLSPATPGGAAGHLGICASMILDDTQKEHKSLEMENECCICMENEPKVILPCTHNFCENCFDSWNGAHNTCPICRAKVDSSDDTWVLTDTPDHVEYEDDVRNVLVGIADRCDKGPLEL